MKTSEPLSDNGSFWFDSMERSIPVTPESVPDSTDVAIIGAGFTGLWTAYYLKKADPSLSITVFEANCVGFGASGRNGGWCMGWSMGIDELLSTPSRQEQGLAVARSMQDTVDEIGRVCQAENIDCHFHKGGTVTVARAPFESEQFHRRTEVFRQLGFEAEDFVYLPPEQATQRLRTGVSHGALFTPHCARIHPARLVRGLAEVVTRMGVKIIEACPVSGFRQGRLSTPFGNCRAARILRATEGYTDSLAGHSRELLPLYSMMIATEPLSDSLWKEIGLTQRETFGDSRRIVVYGQRTEDDRIAFGGRAGYYYGSKRKPIIPPDDPHFSDVEQTLKTLLPQLQDTRITHRWGGLMGVPRHWRPWVSYDSSSGLGSAGGYVGEGVAASNLAARILCDLALGSRSPLTELAWVNDNPPRWEPEPLRWIGASLIPVIGALADQSEVRYNRPSKLWGRLFSGLTE